MSDVVSLSSGHATSQPAGLPDLDASFGAYLQSVCERSARALQATGFKSLLLHSGSLLTVFEDDRTYPFEAHAPFKVWAPLSDVPDCFIYFEPGKRPQLLFHSPADYWHKAAAVPQAYWTHRFDIRLIAGRDAARAALPKHLGNTAYIGDVFSELKTGWEVGAVNPSGLMRHLDFARAVKTPYELHCLR